LPTADIPAVKDNTSTFLDWNSNNNA
jgi:hypothetical protein